MTIRTKKKTVTFTRPFILDGFDEVLPAGTYDVEMDEELLEGISFPAYRRVLTLIHLYSRSGHPVLARTLTVNPNELEAALKRDLVSTESPADADTDYKTPSETSQICREIPDCQDLDRADDEGMIVHQE